MRQIPILISICFMVQICHGQKEHLEPTKNFSEYKGILKSYYDSIFLLLHNDFTDKPYARYTAIPSFSHEYAFSIEQKNGLYYIISNNLSENFWYAKNRQRVKVVSSEIEIDEVLYKVVGELFHLLAEQTRTPEDKTMGNDGTTYYFTSFISAGEVKTSETWSPNKNSVLDRLVTICDEIFFAGQGGYVSIDDIKKLIADIKK